MHRFFSFFLVLISFFVVVGCSSQSTDELVIYSSRQAHLLQPLIDAFEEETGIKVVFLNDKTGALIQRLKLESEAPQADILFTVDAGNLWYAAESGLLSSFESEVVSKVVPKHLKDSSNRWVGVSLRTRSIVYHQDRVSRDELSSYSDLAQEKWNGRLLLRTSKKVYNQSLIAMLLQEFGAEYTENTIKGWVSNLAEPVYSSDTELIKAIADGKGDIGIVNSYYLARLESKDPNYPVKMFWPNQVTTGVHVNISGVGIVKGAPHFEQAEQFVEWLLSPKAQKLVADSNYEYPVREDVAPHALLKGWGQFRKSATPVERYGALQQDAILLMKDSGYH